MTATRPVRGHAGARRAPGGAARAAAAGGVCAAAAAGPLAAGTILLLPGALGGVVAVPGDVVTYIALTGLLLACATLPAAPRLARRVPAHGLAAVTGALAALAVAVAGLVPAVPVFASALMAAGLLGGPALLVARATAARLPGAGAFAGWQAAALAGAAAAAWLASSLSASPRTALVAAGVPAAVLAAAAVLGPRPPGPAGDRAAAGLRDALRVRDVRAALPVYALAGWAVAVPLTAGPHLLTFRWNLIGDEPVRYLAWALTAALVPLLALRRTADTAAAVPWLLLAAAAAPPLMATAPGPVRLAAGLTVAAAAACLAAAALDRAVLRPLPDARRPAAAALTAAAAVLGGLAGYGGAVLLRGLLGEGSALTLTALPVAAGAVLAARVRGPAAEPAFLDVRALSVRRGPAPLRGVELRVRAGECVALFGPGAGTLLAALAGHVPARGRIRLGGADLTALPAGGRTALGLCHLAGPGPAAANGRAAPDAHTSSGTHTGTGAHTGPDARTVTGRLAGHARALGHADPESSARAVLEVFPVLDAHRAAPAGSLGAAERELLGLAEALLTRPRLLLVDGAVAGPYGEAARTVLRRLAATGTTVVLAGRSVPASLDVASRVCVLGRGRVAADLTRPTPDQVLRLLPGDPDAGDAAS